MLSVQPFLVVAVLALFVIDFGSAEPPRFDTPQEEAAAWRKNYKFQYFDNSGKVPKNVSTRGQYRFYRVAEKAVRMISEKHADWCGLALQIEKNTEITMFWEEEDRREFRNMLEEGQCVSRERKGFYDDPKKAVKNQKATTEDKKTTFDLTMGLAIGFGVLSFILVIAILILCIVTCLKSSSGADSPPVRPISMPRRSHRNHQSQRSQRSNRSRRSRSSQSQRSVSVRDGSTRDESG